jgi:hypothetical protein
MAETPIAPDIHEPLDVHVHFCPQLPFHLVLLSDNITDRDNLLLAEIAYWCFERYLRLRKNFPSAGMAYTIYIG